MCGMREVFHQSPIPLDRVTKEVISSLLTKRYLISPATPGLIIPDPGTNQPLALLKDLSDRGRETDGQQMRQGRSDCQSIRADFR